LFDLSQVKSITEHQWDMVVHVKSKVQMVYQMNYPECTNHVLCICTADMVYLVNNPVYTFQVI